MTGHALHLRQRSAYLLAVGVAVACAACLHVFGRGDSLPVIGALPLLPVAAAAGVAGFVLCRLLEWCGLGPTSPLRVTPAGVAGILLLGGLLALPPIAIDIAFGFPKELNLPLPGAVFFYPSIALVAEVAFHLGPLALLGLPFGRGRAPGWLIWPVVLVEPLFQLSFLSGPFLMALLVFGNVSLISAAQLWLYRRHGFLAMIGLRWAFYLFWHIAWGQARLDLLF